MSLRAFSVATPLTATPLSTLLQALSGWPTISAGTLSSKLPVGRAAQLTFSAPSGNAGVIELGGPLVSATVGRFATLAAGQTLSLGQSTEAAIDLSQISVLNTTTATDRLDLGIID